MTDATAPRRWFQIHLGTMVLLVLLAGLIVAINVSPRKHFRFNGGAHNCHIVYIVSSYGWPFELCSNYRYVPGVGLDSEFDAFQKSIAGDINNPAALEKWAQRIASIGEHDDSYFLTHLGIACDLGFLLAVLTSAALLCEWQIRRRA